MNNAGIRSAIVGSLVVTQVVDGSQILAQSLVAAGKAFPGRTARSAHLAPLRRRAAAR